MTSDERPRAALVAIKATHSVVFLGILMLGFVYIWRKKGLQWE